MKNLLVFLVISIGALGWSQSKRACDEALSKKTQKKLDQYLNSKKSSSEKFQMLWDAYQSDEECIPCMYYLGEESLRQAKQRRTMEYDKAFAYFENVHRECPFYHADLYYFLGWISFEYGDYPTCATYWSLFLDFPDEDEAQFSKMYKRRFKEVEEKWYFVESMAELMENEVPYQPVRIEGVSTSKDEYLPMLSPDNQILYYTSRYSKSGMGIADMNQKVEELTEAFVKDYTTPGVFSGMRKMRPPFNDGVSYGGNSIALNNKDMYVTICVPAKIAKEGKVYDYLNCDLYYTHWNGQDWTKPENLGPNINSELSWESQPSISADGNTLYFAKHSDEETQGLDIYYSEKDDRGQWKKARPISPIINTAGNEKSPFLHSDSKTLYYAYQMPPSENDYPKEGERLSIGGYDIFYTRFDEEKQEWTEPKNIGYPINTAGDELGLIVSTDGRTAYFANNSFNNSDGWDLYKFELYSKARPQKIVLVKGKLIDQEGKIISDADIKIKNLKNNEVEKIIVDEDDGTYTRVVEVSEEDEYLITVNRKSESLLARTITLEDTIFNSVADKTMEVKVLEVGKVYEIEDLNYQTSSAELDRAALIILDEFAKLLLNNENIKIAIHGHTDNLGDKEDNLMLSRRRARKVRDYLMEKGISRSRMEYEGFGDSKPVASNETVAGRLKNRRTEFVILSK